VVASPTITYAVDHNKPDVFSATFCFLSNSYSLPSNMIVQQMRRVRQLIDAKIFICNQAVGQSRPQSLEGIREQIAQRLSRNQIPSTDDDAQKDTTKIADLLMETSLDCQGRQVLKHTWFSRIYQYYYRSELESRDNMTNWVRGYLCDSGFKYYVMSETQKRPPVTTKQLKMIKSGVKSSKQIQFEARMAQFMSTPADQESKNPVASDKYYQYHRFGLRAIDEDFYQDWIDNQRFHRLDHLMDYLSSTQSHSRKEQSHTDKDYLQTEKVVAPCRLLKQLLKLAGVKLKSHFFTGIAETRLANEDLSPSSLLFLEANRKDLLCYFGEVARIRGRMLTSHHLLSYVCRITQSYLGVNLGCDQIKINRKDAPSHESLYQLTVPDELYELLSYRLLSDRKHHLTWSLPPPICSQLRLKYYSLKRRWGHLSLSSQWPLTPELSRIKLRLKSQYLAPDMDEGS
jgi:hypothetical protein